MGAGSGRARTPRLGRVRSRVRLAIVCLALAAGAQSASAAPSKAELMAGAKEILATCEAYMPNSQQVKEALKDAGYRYEGVQSGMHLYSTAGRRLVGFTTVTSAQRQGCGVLVSKMTPEEAIPLAEMLVKRNNATPMKPPSSAISMAWRGKFKGAYVRIGILKKLNTRIVRGAAVIAVEE